LDRRRAYQPYVRLSAAGPVVVETQLYDIEIALLEVDGGIPPLSVRRFETRVGVPPYPNSDRHGNCGEKAVSSTEAHDVPLFS
jgi:hypothetical protein